jgi:hypothetical protein
MPFDFIDTAYSCSILFLIAGSLFSNKKIRTYFNNCIAVSNHLLIFYSCYLMAKFYQLLQFILSLNIKIDEAKKQPVEIGWYEIKFLLLIILPWFFFIRKLAKNKIASLIMLVLLQWEVVEVFYKSVFTRQSSSGILFYFPYLIEFKILNYLCLFVAVYALLWLLKRLPSQQAK